MAALVARPGHLVDGFEEGVGLFDLALEVAGVELGVPDDVVDLSEVTDREAPGGVPGSGPRFRSVLISLAPGLSAAETATALQGLGEREGLDRQEAETAIDRMAQTITGQAILDACLP